MLLVGFIIRIYHRMHGSQNVKFVAHNLTIIYETFIKWVVLGRTYDALKLC